MGLSKVASLEGCHIRGGLYEICLYVPIFTFVHGNKSFGHPLVSRHPNKISIIPPLHRHRKCGGGRLPPPPPPNFTHCLNNELCIVDIIPHLCPRTGHIFVVVTPPLSQSIFLCLCIAPSIACRMSTRHWK